MAMRFEATTHLFEAFPSTSTPDWLNPAVRRLEEGVRADELPLVENWAISVAIAFGPSTSIPSVGAMPM